MKFVGILFYNVLTNKVFVVLEIKQGFKLNDEWHEEFKWEGSWLSLKLWIVNQLVAKSFAPNNHKLMLMGKSETQSCQSTFHKFFNSRAKSLSIDWQNTTWTTQRAIGNVQHLYVEHVNILLVRSSYLQVICSSKNPFKVLNIPIEIWLNCNLIKIKLYLLKLYLIQYSSYMIFFFLFH